MAAKIGLTSGAAYRSWKAKNRIPVEAWQKFQAVRDSLDDAEEIIDVTEQVLALIRDGYSGYLHINGRVEAIEVRGKQYECVVCGKRFATQAGKNQYGDPKYCDEHR